MLVFPSYQQFGGVHPETAAITNLLVAAGTIAPHSGEPFDEALLFGIAGGLGSGYQLRRSRDRQAVGITLGFHNRWNLPINFLVNLCNRLGAPIMLHETLGHHTAEVSLNAALRSGSPVMAWVDRASLPYQGLSESQGSAAAHAVVVCGWEPESQEVLIDDLAGVPFRVALDQLNTARNRRPVCKNRLQRVEAPPVIDLRTAVQDGIRDCILQMAGKSRTTALPALKIWARRMTDPADGHSWLAIFRDRLGLYSILQAVFEAIVLDGTDGAALRNLYALFLRQAASILDDRKYEDAAILYEAAARLWIELSAAVLPEEVSHFKTARELLFGRYGALHQGEIESIKASSRRLDELRSELDLNFPLDGEASKNLFKNIQEKILPVYRAEYEALVMLRSALVS